MYHKPVLYKEVIEYMIKPEYKVYLDGTLGGGGHSELILENTSSDAKLIAIDQDDDAICYASKRLEKYSDRLSIVKDNFENLKIAAYMSGFDKIDAILLDIGVSSNQLDDPSRGFSYKYEAKLDMRMNKDIKISAYEVVNNFSEKEIADILYKYGEEPKAKKIASYIVNARKNKNIETTVELAEICIKAIAKSMKKHPAKRTFQALRIFVNKELEVLEKALDNAVEILNSGGRLLVITFHSLEDKLVKNKFREYESSCICDTKIPICICNSISLGKVVNKKVITASKEELEDNNRAHSAKLRIFERK